MTEEELQEQQEQLVAATQFIIDSKNESVNFKTGGQRFKEGAETYRIINENTIKEVAQALQKCPDAVVSQEQLDQIEQIAKRGAERGVAKSCCQLPSTEDFSDVVSKQIVSKVMDQLDPAIGKSMERHHAKIEVHHKHTHVNIYGQYASSETNRNMMCWLAIITILSISSLVLFLLEWYELIEWDWNIFPIIYFAIIFISILGFIIRICSKSKSIPA